MKTINIQRFFVVSSLFFQAALGNIGTVYAARQPVLDPTEADQLRSLEFGVTSGTSLIVRSRQVVDVLNSGAGSSSKFGFAQEGGMSKEILWLRLHNAGSETWSTSAVEFHNHMDVSRYDSLLIWVRALEPNQRLLVTLQDRGWKNKKTPQALSPYFPLWGLPQNKILQVVIPFKALTYNASLDFARLHRLGFQFGRETAGNVDGDIIEVLGVAFVAQEEKQSRILYVDLTGKVEKHPSTPIKSVAPAPTPYPKPVYKAQSKPKSDPGPKVKSANINFAMYPTYFKPISYGITAYRSPSIESQPIVNLEEGKAYLGLRSQKVEKETWFLLDIDSKTIGWVPSPELELATSKE